MTDAVDAGDLHRLAADLTALGRAVPAKVRPVVSKGALNIKNDWRRGWSGIRHAPQLSKSITYDVDTGGRSGTVSAEIGPDADIGQGFLGAVIAFGGAHSAPNPAGFNALDREEPRFVEALAQIVTPDL